MCETCKTKFASAQALMLISGNDAALCLVPHWFSPETTPEIWEKLRAAHLTEESRLGQSMLARHAEMEALKDSAARMHMEGTLVPQEDGSNAHLMFGLLKSPGAPTQWCGWGLCPNVCDEETARRMFKALLRYASEWGTAEWGKPSKLVTMEVDR